MNKSQMNSDSFSETPFDETVVNTKEETDKKCASCGGTMDFDPQSGMLVCPFCGNTVAIETNEIPARAEELSFYEAEAKGNCNWGTAKKTVVCKNCGAETVYDAMETAGVCPYCDSNQVMEAADTNTLAPGGVCPFKVSNAAADASFRAWLKKRWFCPLDLKKNAGRVTMKGIYLPYWTFDSMTDTLYTARYGKTRTVVVGSGKNRRTETRIDWYRTNGAYNHFFNDCLIQGTTRHDKKLLASIEPFDTENNVAYRPEYLSGFAAERYSVGLDNAWANAKGVINRDLEHMVDTEIRWRHHADHVADLTMNTVYHDITYKYLMLPVWMSSYSYKDKSYHIMVNGQTGKVGGKTPISVWQVLLAVLGGLGLLTLIMLLLLYGEPLA